MSERIKRISRSAHIEPGKKWRNKRTKRVCTVVAVGVHIVEYRYDDGYLMSAEDHKFTAKFTREAA